MVTTLIFAAVICIDFALMLIILLIKLIFKIITQSLNMPIAIKNQMVHPNRFGITAENLVVQMHNLLQNGRKTIARIHHFEYIPLEHAEVLLPI